MQWFLNMKIGAKLILGFMVIALLCGAMGVYSIINVNALNKSDTELYENMLVPVEQMAKISESFQRQRVNLRQAIIDDDPALVAAEVEKIAERRAEIDALAAEFELTILSDDIQTLFDEFMTANEAFKPLLNQVIALIEAGEKQTAIASIAEDSAAGIAARNEQDAIEALINTITADAEAKAVANAKQADSTVMVTIIIAVLVLALSMTIGIVIARLISNPIKATASCAQAIAAGKLDQPLVVNTKDEVGQLASTINNEVREAFRAIDKAQQVSEKQAKYQTEQVNKLLINLKRLSIGDLTCDMAVSPADADTQNIYELFSEISSNLHTGIDTIKGYIKEMSYFLGKLSEGDLSDDIVSEYLGDFAALKVSFNLIIDNINGVFSEIATAANQVASGTMHVSDGSQEISQGATEQASSIEELTAATTQIAVQTKQNALNANEANEFSLSAQNAAISGNEQMKGMQVAMKEINESSENISKIIKVIDDIAFQTNILALNAAVEAARAGVHGKGFAVVAEEVRNLAARSANAAKETTVLIEGSIKKVDNGTKIADVTAEALGNIVESVKKAVQLVGQISYASNEQATGFAQVNQGIEQLSAVVQSNSATAEQAAAASEELSSQADLLRDKIAQFKLKKSNADIYALDADKKSKRSDSKNPPKLKILLNQGNFGKY